MNEAANDHVLVPIPRSALTTIQGPPVTVSEATCLDLFGLTPAAYKSLVRQKAFPILRKVKGLNIASFDAVREALLSPIVREPKQTKKTDEAEALGQILRRGLRPRRTALWDAKQLARLWKRQMDSAFASHWLMGHGP